MPQLIKLPTHKDARGNLTIIDQILPFDIKRIFYIYDAEGVRGEHRHIKNIQALICVKGSCRIFNDNGNEKKSFYLDSPDKCLLIFPEDWHLMDEWSKDAVLLVLASENYDPKDYIDTPYRDY